jgi:hypothetical protein
MYGFLVKGCKKCLLAGLHPDSIQIFMFQEIEKIFGEIKGKESARKESGHFIPWGILPIYGNLETFLFSQDGTRLHGTSGTGNSLGVNF